MRLPWAVILAALLISYPIKLAGQPTIPTDFAPAGTTVQVAGFKGLLQECATTYPEITSALFGPARGRLISRRAAGVAIPALKFANTSEGIFAGVPRGTAEFLIALPAIAKLAGDGPASSPYPWKTTRCTVVYHELWEFATGSHEGGVGIENLIRTVRGQPARTAHCWLPNPPAGKRQLVLEVTDNAEVFTLSSTWTIENIARHEAGPGRSPPRC